MANRVEIPVSLGLQEAIAQAGQLRNILNKSVEINSKPYQNISKILDKIEQSASNLQGKLGSAFTSSNKANSFLKEYEKLLEMLESAKGSFSNLGFGDIKFSTSDAEKIKSITSEIDKLQERISNIQNNKISGKLFDLSEFSELKAKLQELKIDPSQLSLKGITDQLNSQIDQTKAKMAELGQQFHTIENLKTTMNISGLDELKEKLTQINTESAGLQKVITSTSDLNDIGAKVSNMYKEINATFDKAGKQLTFTPLGSGESIESYITRETERATKAYTEQITKIREKKQQLQEALTATEGQHLKREDIARIVDTEAVKEAAAKLNYDLSQLGADVPWNTVQSNFRKFKELLSAEINKAVSDETAYSQAQANFQSKLKEIVDSSSAGELVIKNIQNFKNAIKEAFSGIKGLKVDNLFNGVKTGDSFSNAIDTIINNLKRLESEGKVTINSDGYKNLDATLTALQTALKGVEQAGKDETGSLGELQGKSKELNGELQQLFQTFAKLLGVDLSKINFKGIEEGKGHIEGTIGSLNKLESKQKALTNVQSAVTRWMGFYQVLNLTKSAIRSMISHITELDTVMTRIAVVTNMSQSDLWGQISQYSEIARQYGVAIKGVYEVSQIYYQQGLNKGDTMTLTTETLKMARIAGIDYATAADYMTTAIRGFKMEMADAAHVTDVFSNLAAHTASSTEELATAISKTASSAEAVGSSFEATSAMIATMVSVTRESATNIGTALKSVISRYGEMTSDPSKLVDSEGEEMSLNRVDTALQSIGISIHTATGQFRDFDDVILELGEKWDSLDSVSQRYIATIMAGNRQQSRFLSLVGNIDEYKRALELANNSEDVGELQTLKTLDSIDAKLERMKVTIQEFYTSSGIEELYKGILDTITNVISAANDLPKIFDKFPATALAIGMQIVQAIKSVLSLIIANVQMSIEQIKGNTSSSLFAGLVQKFSQAGTESGTAFKNAAEGAMQNIGANIGPQLKSRLWNIVGSIANLAGSALTIAGMNQYGGSTSTSQDQTAGITTLGGSLTGIVGSAISGAAMGSMIPGGTLIGGLLGAVSGLVTNIGSISAAFSMLDVTLARETELAKKSADEAHNKALKDKNEQNELQSAYDKLKSLKESSIEGAEALAEYKEYMNTLADAYPELVSALDATGSKTIELAALEEALANARMASATSVIEELNAQKKLLEKKQERNDVLAASMEGKQASVDTLYQLLFGKQPSAGDGYLKVLEQYNHWLEGQGQETINLESYVQGMGYELGPYNKNEWAEKWFNTHKAELNEFIESVMTDMIPSQKKSNTLVAGQEDAYNEIRERAANLLIESLKDAQEAAEKGGDTFSPNEFLDTQIENLDDIKNWDYEAILKNMQSVSNRAKDWSEVFGTSIENIDTQLERAGMTKRVEAYLKDNNLSTSLGKFASFFSFIIDSMEETPDENWDKETNPEHLKERFDSLIKEWAVKYPQEVEFLMNELSYDNISSEEELRTILSQTNMPVKDDWGRKFIQGIVDGYNKQYTDTVRTYAQALAVTFKDDAFTQYQFAEFAMEGKDGKRLSASLLQSLQASFSTYSEMMKNGQTIAAKNYLDGLLATYKAIESMEDQSLVTDVMKGLDFSDIEQVQDAITQLEGIEGTENLVAALKAHLEKLNVSIGVTIKSMISNASETIANAEKVFSNIGKGMEKSDAIKAAQEILDASPEKFKEGKTAADLIEFDTDLNQWVLTSQAIGQSWENTKEAYQKQLGSIENQIDLITTSGDKIYGAFESVNFEAKDVGDQIIKSLAENLGKKTTDPLVNQLAQTVQNLHTQYQEAGGETKLNQTFSEYLEENMASFSKKEWQMLQTMLSDSALTQLAKTDWKAFVGGTQTNRQEANLKTILSEVYELTDYQINQIMSEIFEGKFDSLTQLTGLQISSSTQKEARKQYGEELQTALDDVLNKPIEEWADSTGKIIGHLAETKGGASVLGRTTAVQTIANTIEELIKQSDYTIEQYNAVLQKQAAALGTGRTKSTIDLLSGGFSVSDLEAYYKSIGKEIKLNEFMDNSLTEFDKAINDVDFKKFTTYDELTNTFKINTKETFDSIKQDMIKGLRLSEEQALKLYREQQQKDIQEEISNQDAADIGKQAASVISKIGSAKVGERIDVSGLPQKLQDELGAVNHILEMRNDTLSKIMDLAGNEINDSEYTQAVQSLQKTIISSQNQNTAFSNIIAKSTTYDNFKSYISALTGVINPTDNVLNNLINDVYHYQYDEFTQTYKATQDTLKQYESDLMSGKFESDDEARRQLQAKIDQLRYDLGEGRLSNALVTAFTNSTHLSYEAWAELQNALAEAFPQGLPDNFAESIGKEDLKDGVKFDPALLLSQLKYFGIELGEDVEKVLHNTVNSYFTDVSDVISLASQGTTDVTKMEDFKKLYSDKTGEEVSFFYDELLNTWRIDPSVIRNFYRGYAEKLAEKGVISSEDIEAWAEAQIKSTFIDSIDFKGYLSGEQDAKSKAIFRQSLVEAYKVQNEGMSQEVAEALADGLIENLDKGGQVAIDAIKEIKTEGLSKEEVEAAFKSRLNIISSAMSQLSTLAINSVVDKSLIPDLRQAGFEITDEGVVTGTTNNLVNAYNNLYQKMTETNVATTSELNSAYAQLLTAKEQKEIDAISTLGSAMGMTYDALGTLLASYNITLESVMGNVALMQKYGIEQIGGGKINIVDFSKFAAEVGLGPSNSAEYVSAFKTYNDSLIALDRKTESTIAAEIKSITEAKPGERVNLTTLDSVLNTNIINKAREELKQALSDAGVTLSNGIMQLGENANIPEAIQALLSNKKISAMLIPSEMAELQDTLDSLLTSMVGLIKSGISGSLNNADAQKLQDFASQQGMGPLDFTKTADGLKLSVKSAMELYLTMKGVDKLQAESLLPEISKMSDSYSSLQKASARYNELINSNTKALSAEKAVLQDLIKSMMTTPDSYNFMSGGLPTDWEYAQNFLTNMKTALDSLKKGQKNGFMAATDFYNIVNAAAAYNPGFSIQGMDANQLIAAAGSRLKLDEKGNFGVNLKNWFKPQDYKSMYEQLQVGIEIATQSAEAYYTLNDAFAEVGNELGKIGQDTFEAYKAGTSDLFNPSTMKRLQTDLAGIQVGGKEIIDLFSKDTMKDFDGLIDFEKFWEGLAEIDWSDQVNAATNVSKLLQSAGFSEPITQVTDKTLLYVEPGENAVKIDLNKKRLSDAAIAAYNETFKGETPVKTTRAVLDALNEKLNSNLSAEDSYKLNYVVGVAQGKIILKNFKKDKKGDWTYEYNGHTFKAGDKEQLQMLLGQVLEGEEHGLTLDYTEDKDGNVIDVEGERWINKRTKIKYDPKYANGHNKGFPYVVEIGGKTEGCKNWQDAINAAIRLGGYDEEGATYIDPAGNKHTVQIEKTTGLAYTTTVDSNGNILDWTIDGKTFDNYNEFYRYCQVRQEFDAPNVDTNSDAETATIPVRKNLKLVYNYKIGEKTFIWDDGNGKPLTFNGKTGSLLNDLLNNKNANITRDGEEGVIATYYEGEQEVQVIIPVNGDPVFIASCNGFTFECKTEAQLKSWLAKVAKLTGGEVPNDGDEVTYIKHNGFRFMVDAEGKITLVDANGKPMNVNSKEVAEAFTEVAQLNKQKLDETAEEALTIPMDSPVTLKLSNATVQLDAGELNTEDATTENAPKSIPIEVPNATLKPLNYTVELPASSVISQATPNASGQVQNTVVPVALATVKPAALTVDSSNAAISGLESPYDIGHISEGTAYVDKITIDGNVTAEADTIRAKVSEALGEGGIVGTGQIDIDSNVEAAIKNIKDQIATIGGTSVTITVKVEGASQAYGTLRKMLGSHTPLASKPHNPSPNFDPFGNNNQTKSQGNMALASGASTLMGELGPELVVSKGRYFLVGQSGAEFVNLDRDAIVFNHIQTKQLLGRGRSGRGTPKTNERVSAGMAKGNINGGSAHVDSTDWGGTGTTALGDQGLTDEQKSKLYSLIQQAITDGFENIDWEQYKEDLSKILGDLQEHAHGSYREFVARYRDNLKETVSKINELYFSAWQADLAAVGQSEDMRSALANLTFFGNGSVGGSSADWVKLFGNKVSVIDLVDQKIIEYNAALGQYVVTNWDKLKEMLKKEGIELDENYLNAVMQDSANTMVKTIGDYLKQALEGTLSNVDLEKLNTYLRQNGLSEIPANAVTQTAEGVIVSIQQLQKLAEEIRNKPNLSQSMRDQLTATIQDTINATISTVTDLISKGMSGTLSNSDLAKLNAFLRENNLSEIASNAITQTANGVIISIERLQQLAAEIAKNKKLSDDVKNRLTASIQDAIRETANTISDLINKGIEGTLSHADLNSLNDLLRANGLAEVTNNMWSETSTGIKLTLAGAATLYEQLKKISGTAAQITLKKLIESLMTSNDHYKTMASTLERIKELQEKIANADKYSDEKIRQYKQELELAKEIAATRATSEDESMNFLNANIPGALNNPTNYIQSWITGMQELIDATTQAEDATRAGVVSYQHLYNMAMQMNQMAAVTGESLTFLGYTLDGTTDSFTNFMLAAANALGSDDNGNFGVQIANMMNADVSDMSEGIDSAIHEMARQQIEIIDAYIKIFEVIVAMEEFKKVDKDNDGLLDYSEIFKKNSEEFTKNFKKAAKNLLEAAESNEQLKAALESVTLNGHTIKELLEDALDGVFDMADMTKEEYAQAMSVIYEAFASGDFDLDNIAQSLLEKFRNNQSGFKGQMQLGDMVIDFAYGIKVKKKENGTYEGTDGKEYPTADAAIRASVLSDMGATNIEVDTQQVAHGTLTIAGEKITVNADGTSVTYTFDNKTYKTKDELYHAMYNKAMEGLHEGDAGWMTFDQWKMKFEIPAEVSVGNIDTSTMTSDQIDELVGKTWQELKEEWDAAVANGETEAFKTKYGFELDSASTEEQFNKLKEKLGIENKRMELVLDIRKLTGLEDALKDFFTKDGKGWTFNINAEITANLDDLAKKIKDAISEAIQKAIEEANTGGTGTAKGNASFARGNVALAKGTLMGELGPELVVSGGRYWVAGQGGAEFVNLPNDAIVFNHLQTQSLLNKGSTSRGKPVKSEAASVAMAYGTTGIAMASAKETLATLKQLKAMWESLLNASINDLVKVPSTKDSSNSTSDPKYVAALVAEVERWYNLLQKIAQLEKEITSEQKKRTELESSRIANGTEYYKLQLSTLENYRQQAAAQKELAITRQQYFNRRRAELNANSPFAQFYEYDENGQIKFKEGSFQLLNQLVGTNEQGETNYTVKEQYEIMKDVFGLGEFMEYKSDGTKIEMDSENVDQFYKDSVQAVWDRMDSEKEEMQALHDSIIEANDSYYDLINEANQILTAILENQRSVEDNVLKAIEDREQATIDALSKERDALQKSYEDYTNGLTNALNKERDMYKRQNDQAELISLRRQLAILQRSGASASSISQIQDSLQTKERDAYFQAQQDSIDAVKEAADLQLEQLKNQVDLMKETLEYEKKNGLLWDDVYAVMSGSSEEIAEFIAGNTADWGSKSALAKSEDMLTLMKSLQQWVAYRDKDYSDIFESLEKAMTLGFQSTVDSLAASNIANTEISITQAQDLEPLLAELLGITQTNVSSNNNLNDRFNNSIQQLGLGTRLEGTSLVENGSTHFVSATVKPTDKKLTDYSTTNGEMVRLSEQYSNSTNNSTIPPSQLYQQQNGRGNSALDTLLNRYQQIKEQPSPVGIVEFSDEALTSLQMMLEEALAMHALRLESRQDGVSMWDKLGLTEEEYKEMYGVKRNSRQNRMDEYMMHHSGEENNPMMEMMFNQDRLQMYKEKSPAIAALEEFTNSVTNQYNSFGNMMMQMQRDMNGKPQGFNMGDMHLNMNVNQMNNDYEAAQAGRRVMEEMLRVARENGYNRVGGGRW